MGPRPHLKSKTWRRKWQPKITAAIKVGLNKPGVQRRRRASQAHTFATPEYRSKRSRIAKGLWKRRGYRRTQLENIRRTSNDPLVRSNRALNGKKVLTKFWQDPSFVEKINRSHIHPSRPQLSIFRTISACRISGHKLEYPFLTFSLDIAFPKSKLVIEVDGKHWHSSPERLRDAHRRDRLLWKSGWQVLHVSADRHELEKSRVLRWLRKRGQ